MFFYFVVYMAIPTACDGIPNGSLILMLTERSLSTKRRKILQMHIV